MPLGRAREGASGSDLEEGAPGGSEGCAAGSLGEARDVLRGGAEPDLVVLDLTLPDGTGHDLVRDLRRDGRLHRVPLVVYSGAELGSTERDDLRLVLMTGRDQGPSPREGARPVALLRKPFSRRQLLEAVAG